MIDPDDFTEWLRGRRYRPATIKNTLAGYRQIVSWTAQGRELPSNRSLGSIARRCLAYAYEREVELDESFLEAAETLLNPVRNPRTLGGARHKPKRKQDARSFDDRDWHELAQLVEEDERPEARVLEVMIATGVRVGDMLRLPRKALARAQETGVVLLELKGGREQPIQLDGAPEAWRALWEAWTNRRHKVLAHFVCPSNPSPLSGDCAYQRVRRLLKKLAREVGADGRAHTHRIRRTVGVRALRVTKDIDAVRQLLGHANVSTTFGYVDEARTHEVAALQRQIREKL